MNEVIVAISVLGILTALGLMIEAYEVCLQAWVSEPFDAFDDYDDACEDDGHEYGEPYVALIRFEIDGVVHYVETDSYTCKHCGDRDWIIGIYDTEDGSLRGVSGYDPDVLRDATFVCEA